jgi:hypothetical protein
VDPVRTTILDQYSTQDDLLNIEYAGEQISGSLHSVYIYLYNNSSKVIRRDQVREPIRIHLDDNVKVITSKVILRTHDKTDIKVSDIKGNSFQVEFEELYKTDGACFQVVYEGDKDSPVYSTLEIAGIDRISNFPLSSPAFYMYVTIFFLISFSLWWAFEIWKAKVRNANEERDYKEYLEKYKDKKNIESDILNNKDEKSQKREERFVRIMNIIAPMIMIGIAIGFLFMSIIAVRALVYNNPKWFVPKEIVIQ